MSLSFFSSVSVSPYHQAEISELISSETAFLSSKSHPQRIGWHQKCLLTTFQPNYPSCPPPAPFLHTGQNILLNACSVRTFTSLTAKKGFYCIGWNDLVTVVTPKSDQPDILSYREDLRRKFAPGKHKQRSNESCHVWHIKNGRIQSANNHLITNFSWFYTYLLGQLYKMPNSLRFWRPPPCAALLQTKIIDSLRQYFYVFWESTYSKSNTIFGKITLMALERYCHEIEENLNLPLFWPGMMSNSNNTRCLN